MLFPKESYLHIPKSDFIQPETPIHIQDHDFELLSLLRRITTLSSPKYLSTLSKTFPGVGD
jgi:hypothetical protein